MSNYKIKYPQKIKEVTIDLSCRFAPRQQLSLFGSLLLINLFFRSAKYPKNNNDNNGIQAGFLSQKVTESNQNLIPNR